MQQEGTARPSERLSSIAKPLGQREYVDALHIANAPRWFGYYFLESDMKELQKKQTLCFLARTLNGSTMMLRRRELIHSSKA